MAMPTTTPGKLVRAARDAFVYAAAKGGLCLIGLLPPAAAYAFACLAGNALYLLGRRRRYIALRNLDIAFRSSLSWREKKRLARASFQHALASLAGFALRERRVRERDLERLFSISPEADRLLRMPHPRGVAFLSSHTGDWEMAHHYLALRHVPVAVVTREVSNPLLDREITRRRSRLGARTISKRGALIELRRTLRRGEAAGLLADQNCPARERFFDFLGVPASTYTKHSRVLARSEARILFIACLRDGFQFRFKIVVRNIASDLPEYVGERHRERTRRRADEIVRRYLQAAEELVRENPEQHLWVHRRWKSRPTGAPWLYHDLGEPLDLSLLETEPASGTDQNAVER